jgi:hypothetical protein
VAADARRHPGVMDRIIASRQVWLCELLQAVGCGSASAFKCVSPINFVRRYSVFHFFWWDALVPCNFACSPVLLCSFLLADDLLFLVFE